jgi:flagellar biosynthesis chaperone FliJ
MIHVPSSQLILTYLWIGASSSFSTASSELESLRSSYKDLEAKLAEAEKKKEQAEKQLAEKSSELIQKTGEFEMKRKVDSETVQKQQKELNGLRKYMETMEQHWDLLNEDIMGMNPKLCFDDLCARPNLYAYI